jgi:hypothetical protein
MVKIRSFFVKITLIERSKPPIDNPSALIETCLTSTKTMHRFEVCIKNKSC